MTTASRKGDVGSEIFRGNKWLYIVENAKTTKIWGCFGSRKNAEAYVSKWNRRYHNAPLYFIIREESLATDFKRPRKERRSREI